MPFKIEADPGKMKHTFTGIRTTFPNLIIHKIIRDSIGPFRVELMRRTESGGETQLTPSLRTYMLDNLQFINEQIQTHTNTNIFDPDVTLQARKADRDTYINEVIDKSNTAESMSRRPDFTHEDKLLPASELTVHSITFDYEGLTDLDWVQPTPDRVQNPILREVVVGLDYLVVEMTRSHSADNPRTILSQESARFLSGLHLLYQMVDAYDPGLVPFHPTAFSLNERENVFNSDGSHDPAVDAGNAPGERPSNTRLSPNPSS